MKHAITPEVAMAIQKNEVNYAQILADMDITRCSEETLVRQKDICVGDMKVPDFVERLLRNPA